LDPNPEIERFIIDHWDTSTGLPSNTILSIAQTSDGYLWIGTTKGLARFDGLTFVTLRSCVDNVNAPREIRTLLADAGGGLWIGCSEGLSFHDNLTGRFKRFNHTDGIASDGIRCLVNDMKGNLWIGFTASYVNRYADGVFTHFNSNHGLSGKKINKIIEDRRGNLLFASRENGLFVFRDQAFSSCSLEGLSNIIITMIEDRDGTLWIGTNNGLFRVIEFPGKKENQIERYGVNNGLSNNYITAIYLDGDGNLWVGTHKGLNRLNKRAAGAIDIESTLRSFSIFCIFEDREKSLWIGTDDSGLKRLKNSKFISFCPIEEYPELMPLSLFEDRFGDIWIGAFNGKLLQCRGNRIIDALEIPELFGTSIAAIAEDVEGNLWLGTLGKGVMQRRNDGRILINTQQGLADNVVTSIFRDSRDNLWFSTFGGVSVLRRRRGIIESIGLQDGLPGRVVHNVFEDSAHDIWIATDRGIVVLQDGSIVKKNRTVYLDGLSVACVYEDFADEEKDKKTFWIGTVRNGVKRIKQTKTGFDNATCTIANGLATNSIYKFLEDQRGYFWLMSDCGVLRVNKQQLRHFSDGNLNRINCVSYGISDGLKSLEFNNVFSRNAVLKTRSGEFWFITQKGISIVDPSKIPVNKLAPPVVIEKVLFNQRQFFPSSGESVSPLTSKGETDFVCRFTAPTSLSPETVRFKYRLRGKDEKWTFLLPNQERAAHYNDLPPGAYTFQVTACSAEGVWNLTGASLTFTLIPYFYQTALFKILVSLLLACLLVAAIYIYKNRPFTKINKYGGMHLNPIFAEECLTKIRYQMEIKKVYCDSDISLQSLAAKISITSHQLSQLLNDTIGKSFFDFINSYRVEEAQKILKSPKGEYLKISSIAIEVGFKTMSAFYKAFKRHANTTPTQYKKKTRRMT
jgi:ligand-binding sensor domain-containing protein/AraC-like DNA-binding protein